MCLQCGKRLTCFPMFANQTVQTDVTPVLLYTHVGPVAETLPFPVPLGVHKQLFPGWTPTPPSTGISVFSWPGILLHSVGSAQVLLSSQFWLASALVYQASSLCPQPPSARERRHHFFPFSFLYEKATMAAYQQRECS